MRDRSLRFYVLLLAVLLLSSGGVAQETGAIRGTVVSESGFPVSDVKVNAERLDGRKRSSLIRYVATDSEGRFVYDHLEWGRYAIFTVKDDAEYANTRASFYSDDVFPVTEISPSTPEVRVAVRLGPKAGVLAGSVSNAVTSAPVSGTFKLSRTQSPRKWISSGLAPDYRVLLPSSTDVDLEVSAPGFKTWKSSSPLNLRPGAEMHLNIALEPAHDPSLKPSKFLVPDGYVGWVRLEHGVKGAQPVPLEQGAKIFKFPESGILYTSTEGPTRGAEDEYFYYSQDGSKHPIVMDYHAARGTIWGQYQGLRNGVITMFGFFVGTEEQYKKYMSQSGHPGPIPEDQAQEHQ